MQQCAIKVMPFIPFACTADNFLRFSLSPSHNYHVSRMPLFGDDRDIDANDCDTDADDHNIDVDDCDAGSDWRGLIVTPPMM